MLMARVARHVSDKRLLRITRRFLEAGMMWDGICIERYEGTPQGGPLSPLLANLLLDDLDKELERRGHRFCRYADDCNIYVRTQRAGDRVLNSVTRFLEEELRLQVNQEKSAAAPVQERQFLGYRILWDGRLVIAPRSLERAKRRNTADHATQQRNQPGADDQRTKLVPDRVGDVLSLCSVQESPATAGRVDSTQAALCTAQTKEARQVYRRLSAKSRRSRMGRLDSGVIGERLVAESRRSTGPSSDEYRLVQGSRSREPL
jgi:hypothetical protein